MGHEWEQKIYRLLSREPVTPSEVSKKLKISYKTAQRVLLRLAIERKDVAHKTSGRIYLFWKEEGKA